jgi:hypothetical protein
VTHVSISPLRRNHVALPVFLYRSKRLHLQMPA